MDFLNHFLRNNLKKKLQIDLYSKIIGVIHRILKYEQQANVKIDYKWEGLWETLFLVLKFFLQNRMYQNLQIISLAAQVRKDCFYFSLFYNEFVEQIGNVFNIFISFGEQLLSGPQAYDLLYYEILRNRKVLTDFYNLVDQMTDQDLDPNFVIDWNNIRTILNHFGKELENWQISHTEPMTPDQVQKKKNQHFVLESTFFFFEKGL